MLVNICKKSAPVPGVVARLRSSCQLGFLYYDVLRKTEQTLKQEKQSDTERLLDLAKDLKKLVVSLQLADSYLSLEMLLFVLFPAGRWTLADGETWVSSADA